MTKRSKSSAGAPIESGATPDVASPTRDPPDVASPDTPRTAAAPAPPAMPAKNGQELGSTQEAHDQHRGEPSHPGVPLSPPGIVPESDVRVHTPAAAAPQPEHGHVNAGLGELPWAYGDARLVGLVRDPTTLFVYWDFSPQQIEQAFMGLGPARSVLKLWNARNGSGELVRETEG